MWIQLTHPLLQEAFLDPLHALKWLIDIVSLQHRALCLSFLVCYIGITKIAMVASKRLVRC